MKPSNTLNPTEAQEVGTWSEDDKRQDSRYFILEESIRATIRANIRI